MGDPGCQGTGERDFVDVEVEWDFNFGNPGFGIEYDGDWAGFSDHFGDILLGEVE